MTSQALSVPDILHRGIKDKPLWY